MRLITPQAGVNIQDLNRNDMYGHIYRVSEKIDGVRRIFQKDAHGMVTSFSRTLKADPWLHHICTFFEKDKFPSSTYYDCELVDRELYFKIGGGFELRTQTNSKASQDYEDNKHDIIAICFDFYQPDKPLTTMRRTQILMDIFATCMLEDPVILVPIFGNVYGEDTNIINRIADQAIAKGGEGLMLQDCDMPYIQGRSKNLIKVKRKEDFIGTILDIEMAAPNTKIAGGARSLICKVAQCSQNVRVGSGLTNEERFYIAEYKDSLIGQEVEIEAFGLSQDSNGRTSLSMPIFKAFADKGIEELVHRYTNKEGM